MLAEMPAVRDLEPGSGPLSYHQLDDVVLLLRLPFYHFSPTDTFPNVLMKLNNTLGFGILGMPVRLFGHYQASSTSKGMDSSR